MDDYGSNSGRQSTSIHISNDDDWDNAEEIELGSEEYDLFLQENYVKSPSGDNKDSLPYKANHGGSATSQATINPNGRFLSKNRSQHHFSYNNELHQTPYPSNTEKFQIECPGGLKDGESPSSPSPVIYREPNFQRFAGNLAPSGPTSVIVSFIMVVVILCVTIVPIVIHQTTKTSSHQGGENVIKDKDSNTQSKQLEHADFRCKCICPPPQSKSNGKNTLHEPLRTERRLYVGNTPPSQCNCDNIVQPHLNDPSIILKDFCSRCQCKYQSRNTKTIRRNVIFFIAVLTGLSLYMFIQYILKYFRITRRNLPRHLKWLSHQLIEDG